MSLWLRFNFNNKGLHVIVISKYNNYLNLNYVRMTAGTWIFENWSCEQMFELDFEIKLPVQRLLCKSAVLDPLGDSAAVFLTGSSAPSDWPWRDTGTWRIWRCTATVWRTCCSSGKKTWRHYKISIQQRLDLKRRLKLLWYIVDFFRTLKHKLHKIWWFWSEKLSEFKLEIWRNIVN